MTWAKIDDRLHAHPKVLAAGLEAMGLWALALSYCGAYLTDGFVPEHFAYTACTERRQRARAIRSLVGSGLWLEVDGGWRFKDWAEYQPTRAQVLEEKEKKAAAGRKGGQASGQARASAPASAENEPRSRSRSRPDPERERESVEPDAKTPSTVPEAKAEKSDVPPAEGRALSSTVRLRAAPAVAPESVFPMPNDFPLTSEARAAADTLGVREIDAEWAKFRGHQIRTGATSTSRGWYQGGWGKWIVDAAKYQRKERERDAARGKADPSTPPTKGAEEHPLALRPLERVTTPAEYAEAGRRLQAALRAGESASADESEARRAV